MIYRSVLDVLYSWTGRDGTGQYWSWSWYEGHRGSGSILHSAGRQAGIVVISMQEYSSQTHASQATALVNGPKQCWVLATDIVVAVMMISGIL